MYYSDGEIWKQKYLPGSVDISFMKELSAKHTCTQTRSYFIICSKTLRMKTLSPPSISYEWNFYFSLTPPPNSWREEQSQRVPNIRSLLSFGSNYKNDALIITFPRYGERKEILVSFRSRTKCVKMGGRTTRPDGTLPPCYTWTKAISLETKGIKQWIQNRKSIDVHFPSSITNIQDLIIISTISFHSFGYIETREEDALK